MYESSPPPIILKRMCGHGKWIGQECLACNMLWRIECKRDEEIACLRARVAELESRETEERDVLKAIMYALEVEGVAAQIYTEECAGRTHVLWSSLRNIIKESYRERARTVISVSTDGLTPHGREKNK
jgi:hypothetical protein